MGKGFKMKASTAERIIRGLRRYGSRKSKVLVKRGESLPATFLVARLRALHYPLLDGADCGGRIIVDDLLKIACLNRLDETNNLRVVLKQDHFAGGPKAGKESSHEASA